MPFPYSQIIVACGVQHHRDGWEDTAVPFPYPDYLLGNGTAVS